MVKQGLESGHRPVSSWDFVAILGPWKATLSFSLFTAKQQQTRQCWGREGGVSSHKAEPEVFANFHRALAHSKVTPGASKKPDMDLSYACNGRIGILYILREASS